MKNGVYRLMLLFGLCAFFASCEKKEQIIVPITDNNPPPDTLIPAVTQETYINKSYIGLLGRKPDPAEMQTAINLLAPANVSMASRKQFIQSLFVKPEYITRLYDQNLADYLGNIDTSQIIIFINGYKLLLLDTVYKPFWPLIETEIGRIQKFRTLATDLKNGSANAIEMHRRTINNYFYDQINMGALNYTLSCFEGFLFRYPTDAEQNAAVGMYNNQNNVLFLQEGSSKDDFVRIFCDSEDYFEGQVVKLYRTYLLRDPNSGEATTLAKKYKQSKDYKAILAEILSTDEFVGIKQ